MDNLFKGKSVNKFNQIIFTNNVKIRYERREYERVIENSGQVIEIRKITHENNLEKIIKATTIDYSLGGCGLIVTEPKTALKRGEFYHLNTAKLEPKLKFMVAKLMWSNQLDEEIFRIGLKYICGELES